jgi:hypothetical protein
MLQGWHRLSAEQGGAMGTFHTQDQTDKDNISSVNNTTVSTKAKPKPSARASICRTFSS